MAGVREPMAGVCYLPPAVVDYYAAEGVLGNETLADVFRAVSAQWPDRVALSEPGLTISYRELDRITDRAAAALMRLGLAPLDRVLFQVLNCKELIYALLGCFKAGLIPICTLAAHRSSEIGQIGRQTQAKAHIVSATAGKFDLVDFALQMRSQIPSIDHVIAVGADRDLPIPALSFDALVAAEDQPDATAAAVARARAVDPFQVGIFQLSGGTSGTPKIIPRFHNEYLYSVRSVARFHSFDETLVAFTPNPMLHNAPMACFWMPALLVGGEVAIAPTPDIEAIEAIMLERRPTWSVLSMVHLLRLKEIGVLDDKPFSNAYGFVGMEGSVELSALVGAPAYTIFGMTEGLLCFTRRGDSMKAIAGTVGRPMSEYDELRIVEPNSERDAEPGAVGELMIRGPCTIRGYYDSPEHNMGVFTSDGFYRSGDLLSWQIIDGLRYLRFEGRVKDVVDRGGEKINCPEIELAMCQHPKVSAAQCVGMPDRIYGEKLCAFVMLVEGQSNLDVREIAEHLDALGFARFKFPERIEVVSEFPIGSSGKVSKPMMRDRITALLKAEDARAMV